MLYPFPRTSPSSSAQIEESGFALAQSISNIPKLIGKGAPEPKMLLSGGLTNWLLNSTSPIGEWISGRARRDIRVRLVLRAEEHTPLAIPARRSPRKPPNLNTGNPWNGWDDQDIRWGIEHDRPIEETADFLCRTPSEIYKRMREIAEADAIGDHVYGMGLLMPSAPASTISATRGTHWRSSAMRSRIARRQGQ